MTPKVHSYLAGKNTVNRFGCLKESTQCSVFKSSLENKLVVHFLLPRPSQESLAQVTWLPSLTRVCVHSLSHTHIHTHTHKFSLTPSTPIHPARYLASQSTIQDSSEIVLCPAFCLEQWLETAGRSQAASLFTPCPLLLTGSRGPLSLVDSPHP